MKLRPYVEIEYDGEHTIGSEHAPGEPTECTMQIAINLFNECLRRDRKVGLKLMRKLIVSNLPPGHPTGIQVSKITSDYLAARALQDSMV